MSFFVGRLNDHPRGPLVVIGERNDGSPAEVLHELHRSDADFLYAELGRALGRDDERACIDRLVGDLAHAGRRIAALKGALQRRKREGRP